MAKVEIVSITPMVDIDQYGRFVKVYRVTFKIDGLITDWIEIPESEFSEAKARELVMQRAREIAKLKGIELEE